MKFDYQARTKQGEIYTGIIEASSKEAAVSLLRDQGLFPTFLEESTMPVYAQQISLFSKVTKKDIVIFSRQLAIMFKSNISLVESLKAISQEIKNNTFKENILTISEDVEAGTLFSKALSRYPKIFSFFYVSVIKSGEISGKLTQSLEYLANHLEKEYHLTSKIRGALMYPALVVFVIILVLVLLVFFVLPTLIDIFDAGGHQLPLATRIIVGLSVWLQTWWLAVLISFIVTAVFLIKYFSTGEGRKTFDRMILKIPLVGNFLQMIYLGRFAENFSTLISSGLPAIQSLEITADIINNVHYRQAILRSKDDLSKGQMISLALRRFPELFPSIFIQMTLVGEKTGQLDSVLMNLVDFYQKEIDRTVDSLVSVLEPILIVFLGFVVGGIMISILMPLYQIMAF